MNVGVSVKKESDRNLGKTSGNGRAFTLLVSPPATPQRLVLVKVREKYFKSGSEMEHQKLIIKAKIHK